MDTEEWTRCERCGDAVEPGYQYCSGCERDIEEEKS